MGYRFKSGQSVAENTRRIIAEEVDYAVRKLTSHPAKKRDESIHEARKSVKKLRGLLKLIGPELGGTYRREDRALRDLGRGLSELRDARAVLETFDSLTQDEQEVWKPAAAGKIRKGLQSKKRQTERQFDPTKVMHAASVGLARFEKRSQDWTLHADGFEALKPGLAAVYRAGRKAMRKAARSADPVLFHDWRKRAKDHWYHVRLLADAWAGTEESREQFLHDLETCLGEDHNLTVLREELERHPDHFGGPDVARSFIAAAAAKQQALRTRALELGERLYQEKPKHFVRGFEKTWQRWCEEQHAPAASLITA